jgi:general secretion pathway protein K
MQPPRREGGYALVAAVTAMAAFAYIAFEVIAASRGAVIGAAGEYDRARMKAAADAGVALAVHGLSIDDRTNRWSIDGRPRGLSIGGLNVSVAVEDEKGKIPLNHMSEEQARILFGAAGVSGERLEVLTDSFNDWRDADDDRRSNGAEGPDYAAAGIRPRNGRLRTVDELVHVRGMDAGLLARIAPSLSVITEGDFQSAYASPLAIAVMTETGMDSPEVIERQRELAGQRTAIDITPDVDLIRRPLTVRVTVTDGRGGRFQAAPVIELTGLRERPFVVRQAG